jgi:TldD protein
MLKSMPLEKILARALSHGGQFADIFFESKTETSLSLENNRVEKTVCGIDTGLGIRVIENFHAFYAYTNDLTEASLFGLAQRVSEIVQGGKPAGSLAVMNPLKTFVHIIKKAPDSLDLNAKARLLQEANEAARVFDPRIKQVKVIFRDEERQIFTANSLGNQTEETQIQTIFLVQAVASDGKILETGYEPAGGITGLELFEGDTHIETARTAARRAITMLEAPHAPKGEMPVVLSSAAGGTMVHEAIGHGLEADLAQQGLSKYSEKMGERVANPLISVVDDPTLPSRRGSYHFDDEGTPSRQNVLVEKGILISYMHDRLSAMKDGVASTGNGRRESYRYRPIPRMSNTLIQPGTHDPREIVTSIKKGLFVEKMGGGQVNTVNGDFVFEISEAYKIDHGKIGEAVRGATLIGNGPEVLNAIDLVGNDLGFGIGTCGKDGQGVPVADAQPTLRIPAIIVGGR